jgi:1-acyl-sn-glycerol-3-phosphate acyltransferase
VVIWIVAGGFLLLAVSFLTILYQFVEPDRVQLLERWYCKLQLALTFNRQAYRTHPEIDPQTQYLFIQNHTSHLDFVAMYNATPHFKQGVELEAHFDYPFYGWFMKARGIRSSASRRDIARSPGRSGVFTTAYFGSRSSWACPWCRSL